jgi:hypothetical protein
MSVTVSGLTPATRAIICAESPAAERSRQIARLTSRADLPWSRSCRRRRRCHGDTTKAVETKTVRCAIYTRKSSEEGLEQSFNSLDAQRESGEACITAQKHEGWVCLPDRYDDGGYSGGNIDRPALRRLLADIEAGKVAVFEAEGRVLRFRHPAVQHHPQHGQADLEHPTLLCPVEREIISERTRDKIAVVLDPFH